MSKNNKNNQKEAEAVVANSQGKTVKELKEVAATLQAQLQDHQKQANHHQTMVVKAQGALEVILQLIPKQEAEEMVAQEVKENHQEMEHSEG